MWSVFCICVFTTLILAQEQQDRISQRQEFEDQLNELNTSAMIGQHLPASNTLNTSSFLSGSAIGANASSSNSTELCQTCQSGAGGVGEAAEKIKALALGNV